MKFRSFAKNWFFGDLLEKYFISIERILLEGFNREFVVCCIFLMFFYIFLSFSLSFFFVDGSKSIWRKKRSVDYTFCTLQWYIGWNWYDGIVKSIVRRYRIYMLRVRKQ